MTGGTTTRVVLISPRLGLHMADALPLRSIWLGRKQPSRPPRIVRWWMTIAALALASTGLAVVIAYVLRKML